MWRPAQMEVPGGRLDPSTAGVDLSPSLEDLPGEHMTLDFPGRRERQLLEDLDHLRELVRGDPVLQERHDLLQRDALAGPGDDAEAVPLPQARIGDADDGRVQDLGVRVEDLLDLAREELLPAAVDHLLEPAD